MVGRAVEPLSSWGLAGELKPEKRGHEMLRKESRKKNPCVSKKKARYLLLSVVPA
jgi:hypothetical protein